MLAEYFWSRSEMMMMRLALVLFLSFVSPSPVLSRPLSPCLSSFPVVRRSVSDLSCYLSHCHPSFHVLCLTVSGSFMFFVSPSPVLSRPSSRCLSVACPLMFFVSLSLVLSCLLSLYCISCHFLPLTLNVSLYLSCPLFVCHTSFHLLCLTACLPFFPCHFGLPVYCPFTPVMSVFCFAFLSYVPPAFIFICTVYPCIQAFTNIFTLYPLFSSSSLPSFSP